MLAKLFEIGARDVRRIQALDDLRSSDLTSFEKQSQARNEAELFPDLRSFAEPRPSSLRCDLSVHFGSAIMLVEWIGTHTYKRSSFLYSDVKTESTAGILVGGGVDLCDLAAKDRVPDPSHNPRN
jgi:hypothetical protein